jgi:hypothetical protein
VTLHYDLGENNENQDDDLNTFKDYVAKNLISGDILRSRHQA